MNDLNKKALEGMAQFLLAMAALIFLPAWTISYWQAWVFLFSFFMPVLAITFYLMKRDPALLARRIAAGPGAEKEKRQKIIQSIASLAFVSIFIVSSLDHRHVWSFASRGMIFMGDALVMAGLIFVFFVFRENSFTSATVEIGAEQKVISTGPYAIVRHPMYAGASVMLIGIPLALGSWWGVLPVMVLMAVILWRLLDEEKFLMKNLQGYAEYQKKVKYRLVPFVW